MVETYLFMLNNVCSVIWQKHFSDSNKLGWKSFEDIGTLLWVKVWKHKLGSFGKKPTVYIWIVLIYIYFLILV